MLQGASIREKMKSNNTPKDNQILQMLLYTRFRGFPAHKENEFLSKKEVFSTKQLFEEYLN